MGHSRFGLIGDPIKGSMSPALFRAAYKGKYTYDLIAGSDFEASYRTFLAHYDGINVTAPFKELAFGKAGIIDPTCRKIGAANLLVKTEKGIAAYNSDYIGIAGSVAGKIIRGNGTSAIQGKPYRETPCMDIKDMRTAVLNAFSHIPTALIIGCGGAGKAAAVAAGDLGFRTILMNRTAVKAEAITAALPEYSFETKPLDEFRQWFQYCDLIIYTLPESISQIQELSENDYKGIPEKPAASCMTGDSSSVPHCDPKAQGAHPKFILEANYKNPSLDIVTIRKAYPEAEYISGKDWLLYQAAGGYSLFTGERPDFEAMKAVMER